MKKIKFLTLLFLVFLMPKQVKAECSDAEIIRLQKLANNITTSYSYDENSGKFSITLTNLNKDLEVYDSLNDKSYITNGEVTITDLYSGKYSFYIYAKDSSCFDSRIALKSVYMPFYNSYYGYTKCDDIREYSYCSKWLDANIPDDLWNEKVDKYIEKHTKQAETNKQNKNNLSGIFKKIGENYGKYYKPILIGIIGLLVLVIYIRDKKDSLI